MALTTDQRKRKAVTHDVIISSDAESDSDFGDGLLEGILSGDEDESGDESPDDSELDEDEEVEFEELGSDEVPSDDETDLNERDGELLKPNGTALALRNGASKNALAEDGDDTPNYTVTTDANGNERYVYSEIDPVYDSDDSDAPVTTNTIGNIPLSFYDSYPHIGYDINGKRIMRPAKGEALDALLDSIEIPKGWTGLTDPATGKPLNLSQDELEVLRRIQMNEIPEDGYDPYPVRSQTHLILGLFLT